MPDEFDQIADAASAFMRRHWESKRAEIARFLLEEKRFSIDGARQCTDNFIATMVYVAECEAKEAAKRARMRTS
jgi:hypothetical protein